MLGLGLKPQIGPEGWKQFHSLSLSGMGRTGLWAARRRGCQPKLGGPVLWTLEVVDGHPGLLGVSETTLRFCTQAH